MVVSTTSLRHKRSRFRQHLAAPLRAAAAITTLQLNLGKLCNQACRHCHVDAGPKRTEQMDRRTAQRCIELIENSPTIDTVDITGGAPEMNANFRFLVERSRALGKAVIDRCNLTILLEPGYDDLAAFLARHQVKVIASLPCYSVDNVDKQRGRGVFDRSIAALRRLNVLGYGNDLALDLVYNPGGAFLPPPQPALEADYKRELAAHFGVRFNNLLTLTNLPIARFAHDLEREGALDTYMALLVDNFNSATVDSVMCRTLVSVGYNGDLFDCDFNQMLEIPVSDGRTTIWDIDNLGELAERDVAVANHCFGCTAGAGSSCGGALL